jgi:hypothetical protein
MSGMPVAYFIPRGQIKQEFDPIVHEGWPLSVQRDHAGQLPAHYGRTLYKPGYAGFVPRYAYSNEPNVHDSLAFGGYPGHDFLRRDPKV